MRNRSTTPSVLIAVTDPPDPLANIAREASAFAQALETHGCAAIHVSSGGLTPVGPSHQVPLARAVKRATRISVIAVWLITEFEQAEAIVGTGDADLIALARTILYDARWPWHAAAHFGARVKGPPQYLRSQPSRYRDLFDRDPAQRL